MISIKNSNKIFLKADYDEKFGMPLNDVGDICICLMGYPEFEMVDYYGIRDAIENTFKDFIDGKCSGFETSNELVDYIWENHI